MLIAIISFISGIVGRAIFDTYIKKWVLKLVSKIKDKFASK